MKKIIALISNDSNNEVILNSAIQLAELLQLEITLFYLVNAPYNWEHLSRSARNNYPTAKHQLKEARVIMDHYLTLIRSKNIKAQKEFLLYDINRPKSYSYNNIENLVVTERDLFDNESKEFLDFLCDFTPIKLIVSAYFDINQINDIVLSSDFHSLMPENINILNQLSNKIEFNLNLVFINTRELQENSEISIENMKKTIADNWFRKTSISIFNAECRFVGAERFANLKGGDLIITEEKCTINMRNLDETHLPILIINK